MEDYSMMSTFNTPHLYKVEEELVSSSSTLISGTTGMARSSTFVQSWPLANSSLLAQLSRLHRSTHAALQQRSFFSTYDYLYKSESANYGVFRKHFPNWCKCFSAYMANPTGCAFSPLVTNAHVWMLMISYLPRQGTIQWVVPSHLGFFQINILSQKMSALFQKAYHDDQIYLGMLFAEEMSELLIQAADEGDTELAFDTIVQMMATLGHKFPVVKEITREVRKLIH